MASKKDGRYSPEMPIKYVRIRFVYDAPNSPTPIYGEWMDLTTVYKESMYPHPEYAVLWAEFEAKEVR